jgi:antibiotic biosynthesis monooxygenase (ABM) superfamily enzyme
MNQSAAAEAFAGYHGTDVYPPAGGGGGEWVVLIHFDDDASLARWLNSPVRAGWVEKLQAKVGGFDLKTLPGGFGFWFARLARGPGEAPPSWKMVLTVLLGLYPTVMLLTVLVGPFTAPLGLAVAMLIGNALSVSILQWGLMPPLTALLRPWLKANAGRRRALSAGGLCLILVLLAAMTVLFRQVTG